MLFNYYDLIHIENSQIHGTINILIVNTLINSIFMILIYSWVHISKPIYMDYVI